jgi:IMP dehydrogenase
MRTFDNTTLVSRIISSVEHRSDCDTSVKCFGTKLDIPIVASPMPDVCNGELAFKLAIFGALGIIHRFQSIEEQVNQFTITDTNLRSKMACAIGITGDFKERFKKLWESGCRIFCLDIANGANVQVEEVVRWIKNTEWLGWVIAGNVATKEGFEFLQDLKVDAIRVGIGGGSVCSTKTETGMYMPTLESVLECKSVQKNSLIIADSGIRVPADMCKALVAGADLVMAGKIFAGYKETPGNVLKLEDGTKYKTYRGAASFGVQQEFSNEKPDFNEGNETLVPYVDDSVAKVVKRFKTGLQSSMSYMNATNISQYKINAKLEDLDQ